MRNSDLSGYRFVVDTHSFWIDQNGSRTYVPHAIAWFYAADRKGHCWRDSITQGAYIRLPIDPWSKENRLAKLEEVRKLAQEKLDEMNIWLVENAEYQLERISIYP